jgi:hypothetical protein
MTGTTLSNKIFLFAPLNIGFVLLLVCPAFGLFRSPFSLLLDPARGFCVLLALHFYTFFFFSLVVLLIRYLANLLEEYLSPLSRHGTLSAYKISVTRQHIGIFVIAKVIAFHVISALICSFSVRFMVLNRTNVMQIAKKVQ